MVWPLARCSTVAAISPSSSSRAVCESTRSDDASWGECAARELPDAVWRRIAGMCGPLERMRMAQCSKRMHVAVGTPQWTDVQALEIRPIAAVSAEESTSSSDRAETETTCTPRLRARATVSASQLLAAFRLRRRSGVVATDRSSGKRSSPTRHAYRVRVTLTNGRTHRMRTHADHCPDKTLKAMIARIDGRALHELTIWDACMSDR